MWVEALAPWINPPSVKIGSTFRGSPGVAETVFDVTREGLRVWVGAGERAEDLAGDRLLVLAATA
jgi:hypothetical protein